MNILILYSARGQVKGFTSYVNGPRFMGSLNLSHSTMILGFTPKILINSQ
jgi:hypothetical protein